MDNIEAPKWADFMAPSPQLSSDDFFLRTHEAHEHRYKSDSTDSESPIYFVKSSKQPLNEICANQTVIEKTPLRKKSGKPKISSCKKNNVQETTYEKVLTEAMNNLQLSSQKMKGNKSVNISCLMDSPTTFKTPKRITRSMCAQMANTPKPDLNESHYHSFVLDQSDLNNEDEHENCEENKENVRAEENEEKSECEHESSTEQTSEIKLEVTATNTDVESPCKDSEKSELSIIAKSDEDVQNIETNEKKQLPPSKVVTSFNLQETASGSNSKKKVTVLTGNAWHRQVKRRMSITNQRRLSVSKPQASGKYVSMAEAVTKFQRATPQRFRSVNVKTTRTEALRRQSFKLTKATSPALMSRRRARPVTAISRDEQERLELEKLRQNKIKANPVRKDILKKPAPLKKVEKKMITNPEPFHLTEIKKGQPSQPKPIQNQEYKRVPRIHAKTVSSIVSTNEKSVIIKKEEVLHFGIPLDPVNNKKKTTKIMPFSFEARNRELQMKKQEKLKKLQESEQDKVKPEFHARPVPAAVKTPSNIILPQKAASANKPKKITIARSLSFEERNKEVQKKKEEKIKLMLEEEKKARTFRAQKVPEFKPVMVRGRSRDNSLKKSNENLTTKSDTVSNNGKINKVLQKSQENLAPKEKILIKKPVIPSVASKKVSPSLVTKENKENKIGGENNEGRVPKILEPKCKLSQKSVAVLSELNTEKRAKQRKEFEEQMKKKEAEEEEMKKKEENEKLEREKAENQELRKIMEIKARPMPVYKPLNIVKSNKPVTEPQSPHWAKRKGSLH